MRVVFFGSGAFGLPTLQRLHDRHEVLAVISQPDRPAGRRRRSTPTPIAQWADTSAAGARRCESVNAPDCMAWLRGLQADAWVVIAFGQKLSPALLQDEFAINLHASLLPRWRGAAPIHHAVLAGDSITGNSVITLADRMDAGDVLGTVSTEIGLTDTTGDLHDRLADMGSDLVEQVLLAHQQGTLQGTPQDETAATLAPKLSREAARLDVAMCSVDARRVINGCAPWPGAAIDAGGQRLGLLRAGPTSSTVAPGVLNSGGVLGFADGGVQLIDVKPEGGRAMPFADWARGRHLADATPMAWWQI